MTMIGVVASMAAAQRTRPFPGKSTLPLAGFASWAVRESTISFFVGNTTGMNSAVENHAEAKLGVVGLSWSLNNLASNNTGLERAELTTAAALKRLNGTVRVLVLKNTQVVSTFWDTAADKLFNPDYKDFWIQNSTGHVMYGLWYSGVGPHGGPPKVFVNFANKTAADWWVHEYVLQSLNHSLLDGVHWDCSCEAPPKGSISPPGFDAGFGAAWSAVSAGLASMGKWSTTFQRIAGSAPTNATSASSCAAGFRKAIATNQHGPTANSTTSQLRLAVQHGKGRTASAQPSEDEYRDAVAAFLIQRGPSAFLDLESGWPRARVQWSDALDTDYGTPMGPGAETGPGSGVFLRHWTRASAVYDCARREGNITML